jgi:tetratricopeptide (TPR) repeat protein
MAILLKCKANIHYNAPEDTSVDARIVAYPCFTEDDIDYRKSEEQARLADNYLYPRYPQFYLSFDHQKHPSCFSALHSSIISGLDPTLQAITQVMALRRMAAANNSTALQCMITALDALGEAAKSDTLASVAKKYSESADLETTPNDVAYQYYLQAAECYEKASRKSLVEKASAKPIVGYSDASGADSIFYIYKAGIAYYDAAAIAPTTEDKNRLYAQAATHFATNLSNDEKNSRESSYSEYRYAASAHYHIAKYQKAKAYYIEAKKRSPDNGADIDKRLEEIEKKLR